MFVCVCAWIKRRQNYSGEYIGMDAEPHHTTQIDRVGVVNNDDAKSTTEIQPSPSPPPLPLSPSHQLTNQNENFEEHGGERERKKERKEH